MRKMFLTLFLVMLSVAMVYSNADAIGGECSNCHTMHNSQDGSVVNPDGPSSQLLAAGCVACHTGSTGQKNSVTDAPIVYHTTEPSGQGYGATNAGGDFYWVSDEGGNTDSKGHNVAGISGVDGDLTNVPPGFDQSATTGLTVDGKTIEVTDGAGWGENQLSCAGTFGCHGTRDGVDFDGIKGAHHSNPDISNTVSSDPTNVGGSFRFLAGIKGKEDMNWNWLETSSTNHNEYYGTADGSSYSDTATISFLCAECHGEFHSDIDRPSAPWKRHPTDIVLPNSSEYAAYTTYSVEAPIARSTVLAAPSGTVTPGEDIVMCLSCHRAHGSDQPDLLRWAYSDMIAGGGGDDTGCFTCHTTKNDQ